MEGLLDLYLAHRGGVCARRDTVLDELPEADDRLLDIGRSRLIGSLTIPHVVLLGVEELHRGIKAICTRTPQLLLNGARRDVEVGYGVGIVDELQGNLTPVGLSLPEEVATLALVVIELELPAVGLLPLGVVRCEDIDRHPINSHAG